MPVRRPGVVQVLCTTLLERLAQPGPRVEQDV